MCILYGICILYFNQYKFYMLDALALNKFPLCTINLLLSYEKIVLGITFFFKNKYYMLWI